MALTKEQEIALLRATLREILRIDDAAMQDAASLPFEDALDGRLRKEWIQIRSRARNLLP